MIAGIPAGKLIDVSVECDQHLQEDGSRLVEMKVIMRTWDVQPETTFVQVAKGVAREVLFSPLQTNSQKMITGGVQLPQADGDSNG